MLLTERTVLSVIRKRDGEKYYIGVVFKKAGLGDTDTVRFDLFPDKPNRTNYMVTINDLFEDYIIDNNVYLAIVNKLVDRIDDLSGMCKE